MNLGRKEPCRGKEESGLLVSSEKGKSQGHGQLASPRGHGQPA